MSEVLRQVALERASNRGRYIDVAWVEVEYAQVGKKLRLEDTGDVWIVVDVFGTRRREFVDGSRAARRHFKETSDG